MTRMLPVPPQPVEPSYLPMTRFLAACLSVFIAGFALSEEPEVDFNRDIRPILFANCILCHGPDEAERAADLRLDTHDGASEDLGGYAAIVPGDAEASEIIARIVTDDEDIRMPPPEHATALSEREVDLLKRWINEGAKYAKHWSYEPPKFDGLPAVENESWPINGIDYFVLSKLEEAGLGPAATADRLTLARRVAIDLTGLPPTWDEAQAFARDTSSDAYERYVDAQLSKPTFGERWARVWLDLARYADSAGYADDPPRTIWAFRDYVIRSLNENKPFDQFTIEQIAGDLLDSPTEEQLIATAFHRNTLTNNEGGTNDEEFRNVAVVDRVNTTMAVWMGTTMACAQCHTHKYDPITHEEYFKFFALLNSTEDADRRNESPTIELYSESQKQRREEIQNRRGDLRRILEEQTPELDKALDQWLAELGSEPRWDTAIPISADSGHRSLAIEDDGWVNVSGTKEHNATYTVDVPTTDEPITGLQIEIPAEQRDNFVLSRVTAEWKKPEQAKTEARFVRLTVPGKRRFLHVAEVEVYSEGVNIAVLGKATQSSVDYGGPADRVIDGDYDGDFNNGSVNHTKQEDSPWVEIDLGSTVPIDRIVIWNRTDGGGSIQNRLDGFEVQALSESRDVVWENAPDKKGQPKYTVNVEGFEIPLAAAFADFEQSGFPASSVLAAKPDPKRGWAVAPQNGKPHRLTLVLKRPLNRGVGTLVLRLDHRSVHKNHLIDRFRIVTTGEASLAKWGSIPDPVRKLVKAKSESWKPNQRRRVESYYRSIAPLLKEPREELQRLDKEFAALKPRTTVPVMRELAKRRSTHIQIRGNYQSKGDEVTRGTPAIFHPMEAEDPTRLDLANWLIDSENPMTARVIANRHWEQLFGIGIVETSEEFGSQGEPPSHPRLLDWLAIELQSRGWDLKRLLKLMVMSATYQQTSVTTDEIRSSDPFNRLLARGPRFRVSAEMVRDQALFVSSLLSEKMYGAPVKPMQPQLGLKAAFGGATDWQTSKGEDRYRRGLYTTWRRSSPYPSMAQFDAPNREVCTVRRIRTNTPLQALVTLNDPVYVEAAQALARQMIAESQDPVRRIEHAYQKALIRNPTEGEVDRLIALANRAAEAYAHSPEEALKMANEPLGGLDESADVIDHAAWSVVANVILNLDELLMKR
ncbi:MAG: DUF1553 domain-containing protein [Planctomycetota bacterium]